MVKSIVDLLPVVSKELWKRMWYWLNDIHFMSCWVFYDPQYPRLNANNDGLNLVTVLNQNQSGAGIDRISVQ